MMNDKPETIGTVIEMLKEGLHYGVEFINKHFENTDKSILSVQKCIQEKKEEHEGIMKAVAQNGERIGHIEEELSILMEWMKRTHDCAFNAEVAAIETKRNICPELYERTEHKDV